MALKPTKASGEALRAAGALSTVGLAFVLALVIGFFVGDQLDKWLGTAPLFTIVFFFLGLAAGILNVFRIIKQAYPSGPRPDSSAGLDAGRSVPGPGEIEDKPRDYADESHSSDVGQEAADRSGD